MMITEKTIYRSFANCDAQGAPEGQLTGAVAASAPQPTPHGPALCLMMQAEGARHEVPWTGALGHGKFERRTPTFIGPTCGLASKAGATFRRNAMMVKRRFDAVRTAQPATPIHPSLARSMW